MFKKNNLYTSDFGLLFDIHYKWMNYYCETLTSSQPYLDNWKNYYRKGWL